MPSGQVETSWVFPGLQSLLIYNTSVAGTLPADLGQNATDLMMLQLSYNKISGSLPGALAVLLLAACGHHDAAISESEACVMIRHSCCCMDHADVLS